MSLKDNYIKLSKKFGGPYSLTKKGIKLATINSILRGSKIHVTTACDVAHVLGVSVERLVTGKETHFAHTEEQKINEEDGYCIPLIDGYVSGGTGTIPLEMIKERLWIPKKYLHSPSGHDCRYIAIEVKGYSMEPLLEEGEIVIIDRSNCDLMHVREKNIYVVQKDSLYYVKHLYYEEKEKKLHLISASPYFTRKHGFEYINLKEIEYNPIIGKVVFSFKRWK